MKNHADGCVLDDHTGVCIVVDETLPFPTVIMSRGIIQEMRGHDDPTWAQTQFALWLAPGNTWIRHEYTWRNKKHPQIEREELPASANPDDWQRVRRVVGSSASTWEPC